MAKKTGPTKNDLFIVLREVERNKTKTDTKLQKLKEEEKEAQKALDSFKSTNAEYKRLEKAADKTRRKAYVYESGERDKIRKQLFECRNLIRLKGATPQTIKAVAELAEVKL